jgi:hypothetical protein
MDGFLFLFLFALLFPKTFGDHCAKITKAFSKSMKEGP